MASLPFSALFIGWSILIRPFLSARVETFDIDVEAANGTEIYIIDEEILDKLRGDTITKLEHDDVGQCIFVKSEEGTYSYYSPGKYNEVCGLYAIAEPDQIVSFEFQEFDISCEKNGLLSVIDGWELNGQFFPTIKDHPIAKEERYIEYCGEKKPNQRFEVSQNVGLIEFRIPNQNDGFKVNVTFRKNLKPCNAILQNPQGVYTIRNFGQRLNCSVSIMFPESFQIISSNIGVRPKEVTQFTNETLSQSGFADKCSENDASDYVELIGGDGLDTDIMQVAGKFCGLDQKPGKYKVDIACGNTAVRMVSSGDYDNSVTIAFDLITQFASSSLVCPAFLEPQ